jgi:hypothetical protein
MSQTASRSHVSPGRPNIKKTAEAAPSGATAKTAGVLNGRWISGWVIRKTRTPKAASQPQSVSLNGFSMKRQVEPLELHHRADAQAETAVDDFKDDQ